MEAGEGADVSVIVVNYNTAHLALKAVGSILAGDHGPRRVDVHLVDNASPMGDAATLRAQVQARGWEDRVTLHAETVNHGFGRANNLVLSILSGRPSPPRFIFLLNPDALSSHDTVGVLADFLDTHHQAGAAGARIRNEDDHETSSAFRFPSVTGEFARGIAFGPVNRILSRWEVPLKLGLPTQKVDWVSGAAVMFRLSALRETGLFDPAYFLYFEEVDLMKRLAGQGWETWTVAEATVLHLEGASTGLGHHQVRRRLPRYWYESWRHYFASNHGRGYALAAGAAWIVGGVLNSAICRIRKRPLSTPQRFVRDLWEIALRPLIQAGQPPARLIR